LKEREREGKKGKERERKGKKGKERNLEKGFL